jgi:CRP-like cAMP-binding protein
MVKDSSGPGCEFKQNLEILRQIEFFAGLPMETLKVFAYLCVREIFPPAEYLYRQDDEDDHAFHVLSGELVLTREIDGREQTIQTYRAGEFIGGLSLLASARRLFSLKAEQETECLVLSGEKFTKAIAQFPELTPRIFKSVAERIREWDRRLIFDMTERGLSLEGLAGISAL